MSKDVPPNSIVAGVPARVISIIDKYYETHSEYIYPNELRPFKQSINEKLVEHMWKEFENKHTENN